MKLLIYFILDPFASPVITCNIFAEVDDAIALMDGIKELIKISKQPAFAAHNTTIQAIDIVNNGVNSFLFFSFASYL